MIDPLRDSLQLQQQAFQAQMPSVQQFFPSAPAAPAFTDSAAFGRETSFGLPGEGNPGAGNTFAQNGTDGAYAYAGQNGAVAGLMGNNGQMPFMQQYQQMMSQMMQLMNQMMQMMMQRITGGQNNAIDGGNNAVNGGNNAVDGGVNNNQNNGGNAGNFPAGDRPNGAAEITKMFGSPGANQVSVQMPAGTNGKMINVTCNAKIADRMKAAFEEVKAAGLSGCIKSFDGCFNNRNKRGGSTKSVHAWGVAFDVNASENPMGSTKMTEDQRKLAAIFEKYGFKQLPNDPMHFQYCTGY